MRRVLRALLAVAIACVSAGPWAMPVMAAAQVTVNPSPGVSGASLTVNGVANSGWTAGTPIRLFWNGDYLNTAATGNSDSSGAFSIATTVPASPGPYTLSVCDVPPPSDCNDAMSKVVIADVTQLPPAPTPSPAPTPTTTPIPKPSPTPTSHPTPLHTATPAPTPTPTPTPAPTPAPTPDPTPTATAAPLATIATPPPAPPASSPSSGPLAYDPAAHAPDIVSLQVAAFTLLGFGGAGGVAAAGLALRPAAEGESRQKQGRGATTKVKQAGWTGRPGAGDRSATWRWPFTRRIDSISMGLPVRLAPLTPLLARVVADGAHLRAMFGSASLSLPVSGAALGALAVAGAGGHAVPPQLPLLAAICALGALDAMAGVLAVLVFVIGVAFLGGIATAADVRVMLGLCALWCAVPVIANAARPLRRRPSLTFAQRFDRAGDFVVASLISAWAVQKIAAGLPGLAGHQLPVAAHANALALIVLAAVLGRMLLEELTCWLYPHRLSTVLASRVPATGTGQRLVASAVRTALMLLVAIAFVGSRWQFYAGAAIFMLTQVAVTYEHSVGNFPRLYWWVPRGIAKATLLLLAGRWIGVVADRNVHDPRQLIADVFLLLTLPGLAIAVFDLVGRDSPDPGWSWWERALGGAFLAVGLLFALGIVGG